MNGRTVSDFSRFVFEQTTGIKSSVGYSGADYSWKKFVGRISEANMAQYKAIASQTNPGLSHKAWDVIYRGDADDTGKEIFECRFLTVHGHPLRASPDLVLESSDHTGNKSILIIEQKVKTDDVFPQIPDRTWPNVRAQLWAYSWISKWDWYPDANVILVAEYYWRPFPESGDPVYLGCRGSWKRNDEKLNSEAIHYFKRFGGVVDSKLIYQLNDAARDGTASNQY